MAANNGFEIENRLEVHTPLGLLGLPAQHLHREKAACLKYARTTLNNLSQHHHPAAWPADSSRDQAAVSHSNHVQTRLRPGMVATKGPETV